MTLRLQAIAYILTSIAAALHRSRVTSSRCCFLTKGMIRCACHFSFSEPLRINTCQHQVQRVSINEAVDFQCKFHSVSNEVPRTSRSTASMLICAEQQPDQHTQKSAGFSAEACQANGQNSAPSPA